MEVCLRIVALGAVICLGGAFGGVVNVALRQPDQWPWRESRNSVLAGIGAALLVPVFLRITSSDILTNLLSSEKHFLSIEFLLFVSFCVLAGIVAKTFIQTVSDRVLADVQDAKNKSEIAVTKATESGAKANEVRAEAAEAKSEAERAAQTASSAAEQAAAAVGMGLYGVGKREGAATSRAQIADIEASAEFPDDPWRGQFGGSDTVPGRKLSATISPWNGNPEFCTIALRVESTDTGRPLTGVVQFFLHPTFREDKPIVPIGPDGTAQLAIIAWGAFTVGALADDGATRLELDLADHKDAKEPFKSR